MKTIQDVVKLNCIKQALDPQVLALDANSVVGRSCAMLIKNAEAMIQTFDVEEVDEEMLSALREHESLLERDTVITIVNAVVMQTNVWLFG